MNLRLPLSIALVFCLSTATAAPTEEDLLPKGTAYLEAGEYSKAEEVFREIIATKPARAVAHYYLGKTLKKQGGCREALASFETARKNDDKKLLPLDELDKLETECKVLLVEIPQATASKTITDSRILFEEAKSAYDAKDFKTALSLLQQAIQNQPNNAKLRYWLGQCQAALGNYRAALSALRIAQRLDPQLTSQEEFRQILAQIEIRAERVSQDSLFVTGISAIDTALASQKIPSLLDTNRTDSLQTTLQKQVLAIQIESFRARFQQELFVVLASNDISESVSSLADTLWSLTFSTQPEALLLVVGDNQIALRSHEISVEEQERLAMLGELTTTDSFSKAISSIELVSTYLGRVVFWQWIIRASIAFVVLSGFLILLFRYRSARHRRRSQYQTLQQQLSNKLAQSAQLLSEARRALRVVPDAPREQGLEVAEALYERAKSLSTTITPKTERWITQETLFCVEEAIRKGSYFSKELGSPSQQAYGCFFCARPMASAQSGYTARLVSRGETRELLACRPCLRRIDNGDVPEVKMILRKGRRRHWSQSRAFDPAIDFYQTRHTEEFVSATDAISEIFGEEEADLSATQTNPSMPVLAMPTHTTETGLRVIQLPEQTKLSAE